MIYPGLWGISGWVGRTGVMAIVSALYAITWRYEEYSEIFLFLVTFCSTLAFVRWSWGLYFAQIDGFCKGKKRPKKSQEIAFFKVKKNLHTKILQWGEKRILFLIFFLLRERKWKLHIPRTYVSLKLTGNLCYQRFSGDSICFHIDKNPVEYVMTS